MLSLTPSLASADPMCLGAGPDGIFVPGAGEQCDDFNLVNGDGCSNMCAVEPGWFCELPISLSPTGLTAFSYGSASNSSWTFTDFGFTGVQTVNSYTPTVATFGANASEATWELEVQVTGTDDDFIGFVFGFDPASGMGGGPDEDYLLLDWKSVAQNCATPGIALSRVTGVPNFGGNGSETTSDFWCHTNGVHELARASTVGSTNYGTKGWVKNERYLFRITYTSVYLRITMSTDGGPEAVLFDMVPSAVSQTSFPTGQIGMYGYSQPNTHYRIVGPRGPSRCNRPPVAMDLTRTATHAPGARCFDVASAVTDPDMGDLIDGTSLVALTNPVGVTVTDPSDGTTPGRLCLDPAVDMGTQVYTVNFRICDDGLPRACDEASLAVTFVDCQNNSQCSGATPFCNASNVCVACNANVDCDDSSACTTDTCTAGICAFVPVSAGDPCAGGMCNATGVCIECVTNANCTTPEEPYCDVAVSTCVSCLLASHCDDSNPCTVDSCESDRTCEHVPVGAGALCATGVCNASGACAAIVVSILTPADNSVTTDSTPVVTGTATPNASVVITVDGVAVTTVLADASGGWLYVVPDASPLSDGPHSVTATATLGDNSASDTAPFAVDLITTVTITAPANGSTINDPTPEISGAGEPGATVTITLDGVALGDVVVNAMGVWRIPTTVPLDNGVHTVSVLATDAFAHTDTATSTFTVDARTTVSITDPLAGTSISDNTPTITGTAAPGASVTVTIGDTVLGPVFADASGSWSVDVTMALTDGEHTAVAQADDGFGNMASDSVTFTVDTATTVDVVNVDSGMTVNGTGEAGATVEVVVDGTSVGSTTVSSDGTWSLALPTALGVGEHTVTGTITDGAGNTATDTLLVTFELPDAGMPDAGLMLDGAVMVDGGSDLGMPQSGGLSGGALCSTRPGAAAGTSLGFVVAALGLAFVQRRRRR